MARAAGRCLLLAAALALTASTPAGADAVPRGGGGHLSLHGPAIFAPSPPDLDAIVPPPPLPDSPPPEPHPPPPPIKPPPPPPPPPPPTPSLSVSEFEVPIAPSREGREPPFVPPHLDEGSDPIFSPAPAPGLVVVPVPRPRNYQPFSEYGPPAPARFLVAQQDEPLQEFLETSSEWGTPGSPLGRDVGHGLQRVVGAPLTGTQLEDANHEFSEISSDWGVPGSAASGTTGGRLASGEEEPLQEFNEISSDWGAPSSLTSGSVSRNARYRRPNRRPRPRPTRPYVLTQPLRPAVQPRQLQLAPQVQQATRNFQSDNPDPEGRFVYSHLLDGLLFTGPHRDSPLDLPSSPAVRLVGGSFSFVSPDGIPVNIKKIRFHSTDALTEAVRNRHRRGRHGTQRP